MKLQLKYFRKHFKQQKNTDTDCNRVNSVVQASKEKIAFVNEHVFSTFQITYKKGETDEISYCILF